MPLYLYYISRPVTMTNWLIVIIVLIIVLLTVGVMVVVGCIFGVSTLIAAACCCCCRKRKDTGQVFGTPQTNGKPVWLCLVKQYVK